MNTETNQRRHAADLAARYNPIGSRAVAAAALQLKVRPVPAK